MAIEQHVITILAWLIPAAPAALLAVLGLSTLFGLRPSERTSSRLVLAAVVTGQLAAIGMLLGMLATGAWHVSVGMGAWVAVPRYHFSIKLLFDGLSLPFAMVTFLLCGTIGAFAAKYLHREPGFNRFHVLYALFMLGMVVTALAGTIETLFLGWELVGLSSALLIAFFHERPSPVRNGLRVWVVYRVSDAALLIAAIALHHLRGEGDFDLLLGTGSWPYGVCSLTSTQALVIGSLLLVAAAGKSALVPFSGWLPRAMEGPTPSSAVFYGALSVHLGAYLLLRVEPLLELSPALRVAVVLLGLVTAVFAAFAVRVQTDIKSALCFASLTQVGLIVAEIGLGLRWLALAHLIGHTFLRTLQFLRAPTLLQDYRSLENALGARLPSSQGQGSRLVPQAVQVWLYRLSLERGYLDSLLRDYIAAPFLAVFRWCDGMERRWTNLLSGRLSRESDQVHTTPDLAEELT